LAPNSRHVFKYCALGQVLRKSGESCIDPSARKVKLLSGAEIRETDAVPLRKLCGNP